jgi:hypothetical protein
MLLKRGETGMKRLTLFVCLSLSLLTAKLRPQEWRYIHPYKGVNIYSNVSFVYDDNIFRYSEEDIDKFVNNIEPYRYPIKTYDDFITILQLHTKVRKKFFGNKMTTFNAKIKTTIFYQNSEKDYETFSFSVWQKVTSKGHLLLKYFFLPRYFIRYYPDYDVDNPEEYPYFAKCDFSKQLVNVVCGYNIFGNAEISLSLGMQLNDYNSSFNEYDTEIKSIGVSMDYPYKKVTQAQISYTLSRAIADGVDEPGEEKNFSDDSDISNDEYKLGLYFDFDLTDYLPVILEMNINFEQRIYTTDKPLLCDPFHAGREDKKTNLTLRTSFPFTDRLELELEYTYETKSVSSLYDIKDIEEIKNYNRNIYTTNISFSY